MRSRVCAVVLVLGLSGCSDGSEARRELADGALPDAGDEDAGPGPDLDEPIQDLGLVINELMASNDGAWVDEEGSVDDWVELYNAGDQPLRLADFSLQGKKHGFSPLPDQVLAPHAVALLWADDEPEQGAAHLAFKLDKDGETLWLRRAADGALADRVTFEQLATNVSLARLPDGAGPMTTCRYATPTALNGADCTPLLSTGFDGDATFKPYTFPAGFPAPTSPVVLSELGLHPAAFIELENIGTQAINLDDWGVNLAPHKPGQPWPSTLDGTFVDIPALTTLAPGERVVLAVDTDDVAAIAADPTFEGVVTLFRQDGIDTVVEDRVDFNRWPLNAVLSRSPDHRQLRYCTNSSEGAADACTPLASREVGDRLRALHTPGDFAALAAGATNLGIAPVKFVIEGEGGEGAVHLLSSAQWPLHYTFIREVIEGQAHLDRCDPDQNALFEAGFDTFIATEYLNELSRDYLLGSLVHYVGPGLHTVEFTSGDHISAAQIKTAFFTDMHHVEQPSSWAFHPVDAAQLERARSLDGQLPIVGPNAPYQGLKFQPLTPAVGFGTLTFVPTDELSVTQLGADVIVVTNDVPNDIGLVGGLITEAFQTPLSHVNLLSQARGTPNMALAGARTDPELSALFGELVRLEVSAGGFSVRKATSAEAQVFWQERAPKGPLFRPTSDLSERGVIDLAGRGIADLALIGAKAAQMAELAKVSEERDGCHAVPLSLPKQPFAVPMVHYTEHFARSGAQQKFADARQNPAFVSDPSLRATALREMRELILGHPVDPTLLAAVESAVEARFGAIDVRFRSSSNAEDLTTFNGAGLYTSQSADLAGEDGTIEDALRVVWASLWEERAFDERSSAGIDHGGVTMGVLVHPRFVSERANGVAMSRNLNDPTRGDQFYINAQIGEASVTNPAPGVGTEQIVYTWAPSTPEFSYRSRSTISQGQAVLSEAEIRELTCALGALHDHFDKVLNGDEKNRWFTMEIEFKFMGPQRELVIKQARPFPVASANLPTDCRDVEQ